MGELLRRRAMMAQTGGKAYKWAYDISDFEKITYPISTNTAATCQMAQMRKTSGTNNKYRRSFVLNSGETSVAITSTTSDASITSQTSNYYPVPVPPGSTTFTLSITPSTQYVQALTRYLNDGVYSSWVVDGPLGYNQGSVTKTYSAAADNCYVFISTKYNNAGSSYPVEPTAINLVFE